MILLMNMVSNRYSHVFLKLERKQYLRNQRVRHDVFRVIYSYQDRGLISLNDVTLELTLMKY